MEYRRGKEKTRVDNVRQLGRFFKQGRISGGVEEKLKLKLWEERDEGKRGEGDVRLENMRMVTVWSFSRGLTQQFFVNQCNSMVIPFQGLARSHIT